MLKRDRRHLVKKVVLVQKRPTKPNALLQNGKKVHCYLAQNLYNQQLSKSLLQGF